MLFYQWPVAAAIFFVLVGADNGRERAPQFVQEPPNIIIAFKANPLTLNCSADGLPKPDIVWFKDGKRLTLDSRRFQLNSGALHFKTVINERGNKPDVGTYRCLARNLQGVIISGKIAVKVAALSKRFLEQPQNTTVYKGTNVRFACQVDKAVPAATVTWEKDGVSLNRSNSRLTLLPKGVLQISNTQTSDEGNYRCTLSNGLKQRQSQYGSLKVLAGVPTKTSNPLLLAPAVNITVTEGQDAVLECFAIGYPLPTLSWKRLGKSFEISQDQPQQSGRVGVFNWKLSSVSRVDEGRYQCSGTSANHTVTASVWLFVKASPRFLTKPEDKKLEYGLPVKFLCKADGYPLPNITWFKDGIAVQSSDRIIILPQGRSTSLQISGVKYEDSGSYQCFAENNVASIQATAVLEVTVADNQPGPPQNVVARVMSSSSILVTWSPPLTGNSELMAYTVYCKDLDHKDITGRQEVLDVEERSYIYKSLLGYTNYSFHVVAFSKSVGLPSRIVTVRTTTAKPTAPPTNLSLISKTPNSLDVSWVRPPSRFLNGLLTQYVIEYSEVHSPTSMIQNAPGTQQHAVITGLTPGASYTVKVAAATSEGEGPFSESVQGKVFLNVSTPPGCTPAAPKQVVCTPQGPNSLRVTWEKPLDQAGVANYEVRYKVKGSSSVQQQVVYEQAITLKGLHSAKVYTVSVKCQYGSASVCDPSDTVERDCKTGKTEPRFAPSNIVVTFKTATTVEIAWDRPEQPDGEIQKYDVLYSRDPNLPIKDWTKQEKSTFVFGSKCETGLAGLTPNTTYFVCVRAVTSKGAGPLSEVYAIPMQLSDVVRKSAPNAKVMQTSKDSAVVSWPVLAGAQGKLKSYTLLYSEDVELRHPRWKRKRIEMNFVLEKESRLSETLFGLKFGETYMIWVRADFSYNISGPWWKTKFTMGSPTPTSVVPSVHSLKQQEKSDYTEDDFSVKLGIIIGCIISAFFTVVLVLFIIWRNPCRHGRPTQGPKDKNDQSMNPFLPGGVALQMSVSGSQGQSSSYEEGSLSSGVCQCRCTCGAGRRVPSSYMFKPVKQAMEKGAPSRPSAHGYSQTQLAQAKASGFKTRDQAHSKDSGHTSSSSVSAEISSDGRTRINSVSRLQQQSISVEV